ncbi:MAG: selenium-dependent molybdenum cofactor biosynthesis protein YqeB [Synergistaceae bacterium]|nr:selenium-dependent molybdenum cofactor biosynthesis protein YqeB [Synergistaceae bacterium]
MNTPEFKPLTVIVRGAGDLATGIIYRLWKCGFRVLATEIARPLAVRRAVSAASAVYDGEALIEDMPVRLVGSASEFLAADCPCVIVDPNGETIALLRPEIVMDAIMAKRNTGTNKSMAPLVIAIGPGFSAPGEVHAVVESKRGHRLGRLIVNGSAIPDTGVPGSVGGYTTERLLRAPASGSVISPFVIGDKVKAGMEVAEVDGVKIRARIDGVLRGLIHPDAPVTAGMKIGDIDPSGDPERCFTITDKALAVAGGALEAIMSLGIRAGRFNKYR